MANAHQFTLTAATGLVLALSGCGTGSGSTTDQHNWNGTTLAYVIESGAIGTQSGDADGANGDFDIGTMTGTYDDDTGVVSLDAGGSIALATNNDEVALFVAEPATGATSFGVVGFQTAASNLPSGTATYNGTSNVHANDGTAIFELAGTASVDLDFDVGSGSVVLDDLDGTRIDLGLTETNVTDVAQITFNGISINNGDLSGTAASVVSSQLATGTTGNQTVDLQGSVFGTNGTSVGGVFILDDTTSGALMIQGAFMGK